MATDARTMILGVLDNLLYERNEALGKVTELEAKLAALRAERRTILDSVTRHCTPEQINAITADTLAARGREGE